MAPKPERARLAFAFGMVLAMAVTILAILTWTRRDLAAPIPPTEPIYQRKHPARTAEGLGRSSGGLAAAFLELLA